MRVIDTEAGKAIIIIRNAAKITSEFHATSGSIAYGLLLDDTGKPSCHCLFWEWGGDWRVFGDGDSRFISRVLNYSPLELVVGKTVA